MQTPQKDTRTKARLPNTDNEKYTRSQNTVAKALLSSASDTTASRHLRTNSATRQNTAKQMLTKSQSVDEIRKKNQAVVDEKKKKQDDKLRKAQQLREAQDKEKHDKQRKLLLVNGFVPSHAIFSLIHKLFVNRVTGKRATCKGEIIGEAARRTGEASRAKTQRG